jgi:DNA repair protein RadC
LERLRLAGRDAYADLAKLDTEIGEALFRLNEDREGNQDQFETLGSVLEEVRRCIECAEVAGMEVREAWGEQVIATEDEESMKPPVEFKVMCVRECPPSGTLADNPTRVVEYWHANIPKADWYDPMKEAVVVLCLNTRKRVIGHNLVSLGWLDCAIVHPREVFRPAIVAAAAAIVLIHNHPSGDPTPSENDRRISRNLVRAGTLLKIDMLDSVIIGEVTPERPAGYFSLRELGYLEI